MQINANNQRVITIKSNNPDWTVRVASKLLLGKGKWEVCWTKNSIQVMIANEQLSHLAKVLTAPIIRHGIETCGDSFYMNKPSLWEVWKQDSRFIDMLMTDELLHHVQADLFIELIKSNELNVCEWVKEDQLFTLAIQAVVGKELEQEGKVAEKLQNCGWL